MTRLTRNLAGAWIISKVRAQQRQHGTYRAALNAKKQGLPLSLALAILGRP